MSVFCPDCGHSLGEHLVELVDGTMAQATCDTCGCPGLRLFDLIGPERSEGSFLSTPTTSGGRRRAFKTAAHADDSPALCDLLASASPVESAVENPVDSELERGSEGSRAIGRIR
jgi:hypothetical protein